jgi:hypothetical protein
LLALAFASAAAVLNLMSSRWLDASRLEDSHDIVPPVGGHRAGAFSPNVRIVRCGRLDPTGAHPVVSLAQRYNRAMVRTMRKRAFPAIIFA